MTSPSSELPRPAPLITDDLPAHGLPPPLPLPSLKTPTPDSMAAAHASFLFPSSGPGPGAGGALPPPLPIGGIGFVTKVPTPGDFPSSAAAAAHDVDTIMGTGGDSPSSSMASSPMNIELTTAISGSHSSSISSSSSATTNAAPRATTFNFNPLPLTHTTSAPPVTTPQSIAELTHIPMPSPPKVEFTSDSFSTSRRPVSPSDFDTGFVQPDPDYHRKRRMLPRLSHPHPHSDPVGDSDSPFATPESVRRQSFDSITAVDLHSPLGGDSRRVSFSDIHVHSAASDHMHIPDFPSFDLSNPKPMYRRLSSARFSLFWVAWEGRRRGRCGGVFLSSSLFTRNWMCLFVNKYLVELTT